MKKHLPIVLTLALPVAELLPTIKHEQADQPHIHTEFAELDTTFTLAPQEVVVSASPSAIPANLPFGARVYRLKAQ